MHTLPASDDIDDLTIRLDDVRNPVPGKHPGSSGYYEITMDPDLIHHYCHECLTWIGFGVVSGLIAKAIMPGRDPGGAVVTMFLGLTGALIGASLYAWVGGGRIEQLISPVGFAVSVAGALVLLISHRLFSGRVIGLEDSNYRTLRGPHYRSRRRVRVIEED